MRRAIPVMVPLFLIACSRQPTAVEDTPRLNLGAGQTKTEVCHLDQETGAYVAITIADPALPAHIAHGDGEPGSPVPGMDGMRFTATCGLEPAVSCPCYTLAQLNQWQAQTAVSWNEFSWNTLYGPDYDYAMMRIKAGDEWPDWAVWGGTYMEWGGPFQCYLFSHTSGWPDLYVSGISGDECDACEQVLRQFAVSLALPCTGDLCTW